MTKSIRLRGKKKNPVDQLLVKLYRLPAAIHVAIAVSLVGIAGYSFLTGDSKFLPLMCVFFALIFVFFGGAGLMNEAKMLKFLEKNGNQERLMCLNQAEFEFFLESLFTLSGYSIRSAIDEIHRMDDADLILERKKEVILLQMNHWNEPVTAIRSIESLHKAAYQFGATQCMAITLGGFAQNARDWALIKGIDLINSEALVKMVDQLLQRTYVPNDVSTTAPLPDIEKPEEKRNVSAQEPWSGPRPIIPASALNALGRSVKEDETVGQSNPAQS